MLTETQKNLITIAAVGLATGPTAIITHMLVTTGTITINQKLGAILVVGTTAAALAKTVIYAYEAAAEAPGPHVN